MARASKKEPGEMRPGEHTSPEGPVIRNGLVDEASRSQAKPAASGADASADIAPEPQEPTGDPDGRAGERRAYRPRPDPFAIATITTPDNALHLGKSDRLRAFVVRFNRNPNGGRDKADPHPVFAMLREAGYRYRAIPGDGMAWQKPWELGEYRIREEMDARDVAKKAAVALGANVAAEVGR